DAWPRTITRRRIDDVLDAVDGILRTPAGDAGDWSARLAALEAHAHEIVENAQALVDEDPERGPTDVLVWAEALRATVESHARDLDPPDTLVPRLGALARDARALADAMDFGFLFDPTRKLLAIGYRV